jgi:signal transduction histidine kinase
VTERGQGWWRSGSAVPTAVGALLVCAGCYLGQHLSFSLRLPPSRFTALWFPGGVVLAALLLAPARRWWAHAAAAAAGLFAALAPEVPPHLAVVGPALTVGYRLALAGLLCGLCGGTPRVDRFGQTVAFLLLAGLAVPALTNLLSAWVAVETGWREDFWQTWRTLFLADLVVHITLTPAVLAAAASGLARLRLPPPGRCLEAGALGLGLVAVVSLAFGGVWADPRPTLAYAPFPLLLWAAVRFGTGGTALGLLATAWLSTWNAVQGRGPFTSGSPADNVLALQLWLITMSVPLLFLAALIQERGQAEGALRDKEAALRTSYGQIQDLAGRLIAAQEAERTRIARELHDDINQQLAALAIALSGVKRKLPEGAAHLRDELTRLQGQANDLADDLRRLSHELHPGVLRHAGLAAALQARCAELARQHGLEVAFAAEGDLDGLPPEVALCLYRVAQEALHNVAHHAGARRVRVTLARAAGALELSVRDDGQGFDLAEARRAGGLGLISLDERVRLVRGSVRIDTRPQWGTELRVQVPLGGHDHAPREGAACR